MSRAGAAGQILIARQALSRCAAILGSHFYAAKPLPLDEITRALRELEAAKDALRRCGVS